MDAGRAAVMPPRRQETAMALDMLGRTIDLEDLVAYPVRAASQIYQKIGRVVSVDAEEVTVMVGNRRFPLVHLNRVVIVHRDTEEQASDLVGGLLDAIRRKLPHSIRGVYAEAKGLRGLSAGSKGTEVSKGHSNPGVGSGDSV